MTEKFNTGIIGAGPGGITAGIQLKRCGIDFVLIEKKRIGGLVGNANLIENFPGFPRGIRGNDLVALFNDHLESLGIDVLEDEVTYVDYKEGKFEIHTGASLEIQTDTLIIASGTRARELKGVRIDKGDRKRIFYEVVPIQEVKRKKIVIIGAGDAAFDYALNLARNNEVNILNRGTQTKCLPLLFDRALQSENIEYHISTRVDRIYEEGNHLKLVTSTEGEKGKNEMKAHFLLGAIGREPEISFFSPMIRRCYEGKIKIPGLYFAGDVIRGITRQATISIGDGMLSAMDLYLRK